MSVRKKLLVVEDNPINRMMLSEILSPEYQILEAENGQAALDVLRVHAEDISLILLDIIMPVMDGYTFLSIAKADPIYASIPVIVATQSDSESDEVAALAHGAADFVSKPYKPRVILHRVAGIINLRESAAMINQFQYDRLTGLYSKEFFCQKARELMLQAPEREYDIICSDIENFKLINDIFGIPAGDQLLRGIAELYLELLGEHGICGRFNADQFACLAPRRLPYREEPFARIEERISALSASKRIAMNWGVYAVEETPAASIEQMCDRAFLAARSIKGQFGKHFAIYDDALRGKLLQEQAITDIMETALAEEQFVIYLQPKYGVRGRRLSGAEALVRWIHPEWGLQSPGVFIPLFEKNGFITKLDQFVWDKTCAVLKSWEEKGYPPIPISVNVSRADIYNADIADILTKTVRRYDLPPSRLHLEITESAYTENPEQMLETIGHLRELGFVIEMDDFGSGYSSLNMLNRMPLDILKLDMKFIQTETAKPVNRGIIRFIMDLAGSMGLSVVAEGVETWEQFEYLREIGCNYVQGYYFAKPMPIPQFEALLTAQSTAVERRTQEQPRAGLLENVLLIADGDAQYRQDIRGAFEGDYKVVEAADVQEALSRVVEYGRKIAAVILNLNLPEPDGFVVLDRIQREKEVWNIPVIAVAPAASGLEERALELGVDEFVDKSRSLKVLRQRVRRAVSFTSLREREHTLRDEACQDYLTGLLNRRGLGAATSFLQEKDAPAAVYVFDLDNMRRINARFGHAAGDELLKSFSLCLRSQTRETDILARYGGDEFVVILKQVGSEENALKKGDEICLAACQEQPGQSGRVSCSAGVALWDVNESLDEVINRADRALCRAKNAGTNGCLFGRE